MAYEPTLDDVLNSLYGPEGGLTEEELAQYMPEPYVAPEYVPQGGGYAPQAGYAPATRRGKGAAPDTIQQAYSYMVERGLPRHVAAGLAGGFMQESGGVAGGKLNKEGGMGLGQWRKERLYGGNGYTGLIPFARSRGASIQDWRTQIDYALNELEGPERKAFERLLATKTPEEAALIASQFYERPAKEAANNQNRIKWANSLYSGQGVPQETYAPTQFSNAPEWGAQLNPAMVSPVQQLIDQYRAEGIDLRVQSGHRDIEEQRKLYAQGRTAPGKIVTWTAPEKSKHVHGDAVDLVPYVNGKPTWDMPEEFWQQLGQRGTALGLEWGGNWKKSPDRPHFQMSPQLTKSYRPSTQSQDSPFDIVKLSDGTSVDVAKGSSLADLAVALKASGIDAEPLKQVALPDGSYVDAPFSYADEQVLEGMRHHAPDAFGEQPEEASNRGYGAAAKSSFEAGIGSALTGLGGLGAYAGEKLESPLARQAGEYLTGKGKEWQKMGEEAYQELTPEEAEAMGFGGQFRKYVGEPVAGFVGSMGAALPALALPGGAATRIGAFAAQELGGQLAEQERMGQEADVEKALPYAVGSGIVQNSLLGPLKYVTKAFGKPDVLAKIAEITEKKGADAAKQYAGGMMKNILKETGINTGEVVISEVISRAAERAASGQPLDTPDAIAEYEDIAVKSIPGGLLGIPGAFGVHAAKQGTIEEVQLAQAQEAQNIRIAEEQKAAEEAAAVEVQKQAEADAELERQAGIGVPEPTIRGQENVAPTEPPLAAEEQPAPVESVSAPPPVAPEMGAVEIQAEPEADEIPEPTIRGKEPKLPEVAAPEVTNPADILGLNKRSGLRRQLRGLDVNKAEDHPKIDAILQKTSAAFSAENLANLETKMKEVQSANGIQKPAAPNVGSFEQPEIRQEGQGAPVSSEGVRSSGQEIGAVKIPEVKIPEAETIAPIEQKVPSVPEEVKAPVSVEKLQTPAEAWDSLRTPDQPAFESLSKNTQDLWKKEYKENEGIVSKDAVADYVKAEQPERLLAKGEAPKEIEVEGVKRPTTDSTGAPIHTTEEGVKNFWKAFKDTKVVDEKGRPLRVYHGGRPGIKAFAPNMLKDGIQQFGLFFAPDSYAANAYTHKSENPQVYPVYLDIKNPKYVTDTYDMQITSKEQLSKLIAEGYDGLIYPGTYEKTWIPGRSKLNTYRAEIAVFSPNQIKSAIGNKGEFDVSKPDIRESKGEPAVANPHTKETIQSELKKLYGENAPQIEVSDRATENVDAATKGFFEPSTGRAVLVADNIGKGEDLHGLLRHEVAVHAKKLGKSDKEFQDILKQVDNLKEQGAKDVTEAFDRVPEDTKPADRTHEALAYLVQNKPNLPIVKRFMSWLRRTANKITGNAKWLKGDDFAVMADAVLKKAAKEAKTEMKVGKPEERQYAKAPLVKETEAESSLKRGMKEAVGAFKGNAWTRMETNYVNRHAALADAIKDKATIDSNGKYRADLIGGANDQIFNVISAGATDGIPVYNKAGTVMIQKNDKFSPDNIVKSIDKLKVKDPRPYVGFIMRALRGEELKKEDAEAIKQIDILEEKAKKLKAYAKTQAFAEGKKADTLANRYLAEAKKLKDRVGEEGREKLVSDEDILEAKRRLAEHPEIQEILDNVRGLMNSLVDLAIESGWVSKEVGKEWKSKPNYFPLYMSQEDILNDPSKVVRAMGGGAKSLPNVKALKGGTHAINMLENLYKHYAFMISASAQNTYRKAAARDLELFGAARRTSPDTKNAIMFKDNGKEVYYEIDDPLMFEAFQAAAPLTNPLLKAARGYTKAFRVLTLVNPLYWYRQLIRDPIHANVVSQTGMVTPIGATISFAKIIAGASPEYAELRRRGVVGAVDALSDPARFKKIYDKGPNLFKKGADWVMHVHEAADAATRVEVYKAAAKEAKKRGMSKEQAKDYATMRAREIINFANQGRSETLQAIRATVPFFSAALNSLDSVARAAAGKGLNRREAAEARRLFTSRMLMIASFTTAYALAMQDDEDYLKSPDSINNWLIPTGDKENPFIMIPLPFELGFVAKVIPELIVRLNSGTLTAYEGKKALKEAAGATLTPPLPFPQIIKPAVEAAINYDLHQGRPIVSPSEAGKLPEEQTKGASALSIEMGRQLGLSPAQIEHFGRGYLTELWTAIGVLSDAFLPAGQYKEAKGIAEIPTILGGAKGILSKPDRDRDMDIFYELANGAQQIKRSMSAAQGKGDVEAMERIMADPEKKKRFYASDVGRNIGDEISEVNKAIEQIRNDKAITDPKKKQEMIREKQQYKNRLATQGKEWFYSLGVNEP